MYFSSLKMFHHMQIVFLCLLFYYIWVLCICCLPKLNLFLMGMKSGVYFCL